MATFTDIGDNAAKCLDLVTVSVDPSQSESVIIKNVAGDTLSVFKDTISSSAASTLTATQSATVTTPAWIRSAGRTSVQLTGGKYGS